MRQGSRGGGEERGGVYQLNKSPAGMDQDVGDPGGWVCGISTQPLPAWWKQVLVRNPDWQYSCVMTTVPTSPGSFLGTREEDCELLVGRKLDAQL